jgi:hypothetical protein
MDFLLDGSKVFKDWLVPKANKELKGIKEKLVSKAQ